MQPPVQAREFLDLIARSGLLSDEQVQKVGERYSIDPAAPAEETARRLVREKLLTPFQAERLLEGRYRGLVIDRYRIRELLGFGGMGCVFIAEDPEENRKVALKVMSSEHALDAGMLARLKLEAAAGMKLTHPNIVRTYRLDSTGAVHFLVMELVRGISLHELVALFGAVKWPIACDIIMQAAEALQAAHDQGIVHRDIKPANFLIEMNGVTRILDFGLALIHDGSEEEFSLSMVFGHDCLGTPDYIAPEQTLDSSKVDARADVYSLGATFFVALTSHVPFPEKTNKLKLEAHRTKQPRDVRTLRPDIPEEVSQIVARMLQKNPDDRFQSMKDVVEVLKPLAKRKKISFDFRELVTLRAKQARSRAEAKGKKHTAPRSSITSSSGWIQSSGHQFSDSSQAFASADTEPQPDRPGSARVRSSGGAASSATVRVSNYRGSAPSGWRLEDRSSRSRIPLVKIRNSVGKGSNADIHVAGDHVDDIQCWIEYDGISWSLRQESLNHPTFVNGSAEAYCALRHGSRLSFGGPTHFRLVYLPQEQTNRRRLVLAIVLALLTLAAVAVALQFRN